MSVKLLEFLKSGPPAPRVVLLPDHRFFVRTVPVAAATTPAELPGLIELALEGLAPFPPPQLYYGHYWVPGAAHALVFASYRKRFTTDQAAEWGGAELVTPVFATLLGAEHEPATTLLVPSADGLTAIHWDGGAVPAQVLTCSLPPEADEAARTRARDELLRAAGGSRKIIDLSAAPEILPSPDEQTLLFRAGEVTVRLPVATAASLDVRDKTELAALRGAHRRDLVLWRVFAGSAATLALLLVGELALNAGGGLWQKQQLVKINAQRPVVEEIMIKDTLATRIEELSTKRLLPFEMIALVNSKAKRGSIQFTRTTTSGLYTLEIEAKTPNAGDVDVYRAALRELPAVAGEPVVKGLRSQNGFTTFTLVITFKPELLKPWVQS